MAFKFNYSISKIFTVFFIVFVVAIIYSVDRVAESEQTFPFLSWVSDNWALCGFAASECLALLSSKYSGLLKICLLLFDRGANQVKSRSNL